MTQNYQNYIKNASKTLYFRYSDILSDKEYTVKVTITRKQTISATLQQKTSIQIQTKSDKPKTRQSKQTTLGTLQNVIGIRFCLSPDKEKYTLRELRKLVRQL